MIDECMMKDQLWIGTTILDEVEFANTAQGCQKLCFRINYYSSNKKCCIFNWDYLSGDCTLYSDYKTALCSQDDCHYISGLWTCDNEEFYKVCPGVKKQIEQNQNNQSLTRPKNLSLSTKNPKFEPSKQFESIGSQRGHSKTGIAKKHWPKRTKGHNGPWPKGTKIQKLYCPN